MPPSTATQVETLRLTVWTVYSVTVELATSARPGSSSSRLSGPSSACTVRRRSPRRSRRSPAAAGRRCRRRRGRRRGCRPGSRRAPAIARTAARNGSSSSSCEPMWKCSPTSSRCGALGEPLDRLARGLGREAELRVGLPGRDRVVGVAGDARGDPDQHLLPAAAELGRDPLQPVELVAASRARCGRRPRSSASRSSDVGLGVAVQVDPRRVEAAPQRQGQLAARGDVAGQPLLGEQPVDRGARKRLGGEQHVEVAVAGGAAPRRTSAPARAGRPRRRRRPACRTRARARPRRSRRSRAGRAR